MVEELRELATKEDSSDEEQEASPKVSQNKAPRTVTSPIPLFGIPSKASAVSFGTFDDASVWDSVSSTMLKQSAPPKQKGWIPVEDLLTRKATAIEKGNSWTQ